MSAIFRQVLPTPPAFVNNCQTFTQPLIKLCRKRFTLSSFCKVTICYTAGFYAKMELLKLKGLQINTTIQDYEFLGKSSTDSGLNWWAVDGRASVGHTNALTIKMLLSYFLIHYIF